jgi:hypothetical protein
VDYVIKWCLSLLIRSAQGQSAVEDGSTLVFPLGLASRVILGVVILSLATFTISLAPPLRRSNQSPLAVLIPLALLTAIMLSLPGTIILDETGIRQSFWWRPP